MIQYFKNLFDRTLKDFKIKSMDHFIISEYQESEELHIFPAVYDKMNERYWIKQNEHSVFNHIKYDSRKFKDKTKELDIDGVILIAAKIQVDTVNICANCISRFYSNSILDK